MPLVAPNDQIFSNCSNEPGRVTNRAAPLVELTGRYLRTAIACFVLLCCVSLPVVATLAKPILDYPALTNASRSSLDALRIPSTSAFHTWEQAALEAQTIIASWQTEPVSLAWTRVQLDRYVKHKMMPTRGARGLALMHVAMHDAYEFAKMHGVDTRLATSMAAAQVLGYLFVAEERTFDRIVYELAARTSAASRDRLPETALVAMHLGLQVGKRVLAYAETDGAQFGWNGARLQFYGEGRVYGPGTWQPTPPYFYYPPDEPFAPQWRSWVLQSAMEFRPTPPAFGSKRYLDDLKEVIDVNKALSAEQLKVARYWVDGHGSVTPPGRWNRIAIDAVMRRNVDEKDTLRLFAQMNIALADTFIAVWDTKYFYWTARPITVAKTMYGEALVPPLLTPPFPSYVSGHAAFSGAASKILSRFIREDAPLFARQAEEATNSRLFGGIHFRHDNEDGLTLGRKIGQRVLNTFN
jgi:hypothetical protein